MKNYIGFLNDYSGSMGKIGYAAVKDYNQNVAAVVGAATANMQDTVVSMFGFSGMGGVQKEVVNSNPHVLKPLLAWKSAGPTPMNKAILEMIAMFKTLPDYNDQNVSFLILATTDGVATDQHLASEVAREIANLTRDERWTFVFRVPTGARKELKHLNIPQGNIQEWSTTEDGMAASTVATTQAFDSYYALRATGKKSSTVFYADASKVDASAVAATLKDISGDVSLYVVPSEDNGIEIRHFILTKRMEYLKGSAFYQLTKTEAKVTETKLIAIRDRTTRKIYSGIEARKLTGLPVKGNVRLHPGDHGNFDIFVQSSSTNRKLVGGTGVLYWKAIGVPFTATDEAYLQPKVVNLPIVPITSKPTKSSIPVKKVAQTYPTPICSSYQCGRVRFYTPPPGTLFYKTRESARIAAKTQYSMFQYDAGPTAEKGKRYYVGA